MKKSDFEALIKQASLDSVIEIECPQCGATIIAEPDAEDFYCAECERITGKNPLTQLGLI
jgi:ribosomal protein S27AE